MSTILIFASLIDPLIAKLEESAFLTGSFTQTDIWALTLDENTSDGLLYLAQPDLFRLEYSDESGGGTNGFDGEVIYTIEPEYKQVITYTAEEQGSFLHLLEECNDTSLVTSEEVIGDSLMLVLDGDFGGGINRMEVGYLLADSLPYHFSTTDVNGNSTTYVLWNLQVYPEIPEGTFNLVVPENYELVEPERY